MSIRILAWPPHGLCRTALTVGLALNPIAGPAAAQRPDPTQARAEVPRATYVSPLAGYRRHAEQPVGDWKGANDEVHRIGGWRTYLRDGPPPPAAAPASSATSAAAAPPPASGPTSAPARHRH